MRRHGVNTPSSSNLRIAGEKLKPQGAKKKITGSRNLEPE
jgi:hypothetical protein